MTPNQNFIAQRFIFMDTLRAKVKIVSRQGFRKNDWSRSWEQLFRTNEQVLGNVHPKTAGRGTILQKVSENDSNLKDCGCPMDFPW